MATATPDKRRAAYMFHLGDQLKKTVDDESCDVILECKNGKVKCHKNIMEAGCEKFRITPETCRTISRTAISFINMTWLTVETGRELMSFIYTGSCKITDDKVSAILETSITWGVSQLTEECYIHMMRNCTTKNACMFYELERKHNHEKTHKYLLQYIRGHYLEIMELARFADLRVCADVLDHDEVNVSREDDPLLDSLMDFIEENADAGDDPNKPGPGCPVSRIEHTDNVHLNTHVRSQPPRGITNKSQRRNLGEKLVCIDLNKSVRAYCKEEKEWKEVMKSVPWMDFMSIVQTYLDGLIVVSAMNSEGSKHVSYVDLKAGVVQELPDLPQSVNGVGVVCVEEEVYVLGGWCNEHKNVMNVAWKLVNKQQWEQLPSMIHNVNTPTCAIHKDTIYVISSPNTASTDTHVQSFNINTMTWALKKELPRGCCKFESGVVIHADKLTVITNDQMMSYDDVTDNWDIVKYNSITDRVLMTPMKHEGQICAHVWDKKVLQYDPQDNSWSVLADDVPMPLFASMMLSVEQY